MVSLKSEHKTVFLEFDLSGAEWVVVAYLSGDPNMLAVVNGKDSPHEITGHYLSGLPVEMVVKENKIVGNLSDPVKIEALRREHMPELFEMEGIFLVRSMSIRQAGKKSNHGLNYDMKYKRFALETEIPENESYQIVEFYHKKAYPGIRPWHRTIRGQLEKDRTLVNCFGRKRKFMDAWGPELFDAAYSYLPQSTVFDVCEQAMRKVYYADDDPVLRAALTQAQVHDSILYGYPWVDLSRLCEFVTRMSTDIMKPTLVYNSKEFQLDVTLKMGFDWGHMLEIDISDLNTLENNIKEGLEKLCQTDSLTTG